MGRSFWFRWSGVPVVTALLFLGLAVDGAPAPPAREAHVIASLAPGAGGSRVEARLVIATAAGDERATPLKVPGEVTLPVSDPPASVRLEAPGYWSRSFPLSPGEVRLRLHPLAHIEGAVSVRGRGAPPDALRFVLDGTSLVAPVTLSCPVDRGGRFSCDGPAGRFDLQVRSPGFAPDFQWDVDLKAQGDTALKPVVLTPGASVSGFLQQSDGTPAGREATIRLAPQVFRETGSRDTVRGKSLAVLERDTRPGERGFFVFADVPPGRYDLEFGEPGSARGRFEGLEVREGAQVHITVPLEIARKVGLQVQLSPAVAPSGERWRLRLLGQKVQRTQAGLAQACDDQGYVEFPALPEDHYMLIAEDPQNGQPFETREVEVAGPVTFVDWELPLVSIEGTVRLGREPLPAKVSFGPTKPSSRDFEADEDGAFSGVLSKAGEWEVLVENREQGISRWFRDVQVPEPSEPGDVVRVALDLPATELSGLVVDEEFRPIRGQILVQPLGSRDRSASSWSRPNGRFVVRGLPPGPVELMATAEGDRASPVTTVSLAPDAAVGSIQLRVERRRTVQGSVQGPDGPVRGARVALRGAGSPLYTSTTVTVTTDARGLFTLDLPAGMRDAHLEVRAAGYPLTVRRIPVGEALHLSLNPVWGTAEVDWDQALIDRLWMVKDGASWRFSQFVTWAMAHPGEGEALPGHTQVPRLEPGVWHLCAPLPGSAEWVQMVALGAPGQSCERMEVTAWGTTTGTVVADHGRRTK
jgi:hypothetical protein